MIENHTGRLRAQLRRYSAQNDTSLVAFYVIFLIQWHRYDLFMFLGDKYYGIEHQ